MPLLPPQEASAIISVHASTTKNTTQLSDLPLAVLTHILQHVPQQQRLTSAALAASSWAKAAAHATVKVQNRVRAHTAPGFEAWLEKYAGQVESIDVRGLGVVRLELPWAQLSSVVSLNLASLELPAISTAATTPTGNPPAAGDNTVEGFKSNSISCSLLPRLKECRLLKCDLASTECLLQLASSRNLTKFVLLEPCVEGHRWHLPHSPQDKQHATTGVGALLQHLPQQLQVLDLGGIAVSFQDLKYVQGMQQPVFLSLGVAAASPDTSFAGLPKSITELVVDQVTKAVQTGGVRWGFPLQLQHLSNLQALTL